MTGAIRLALLLGVAGLAVAALGWVQEPRAFFGGWLAALTVLAGLGLGSVTLVLAHALTGGRWGDVVRPALFAGIATLPLLLPAAVPLALGLPDLYPWARPEAHPANAFYLNVHAFGVRAVVYLAIWFAVGALVLGGVAPRRIAPPALFLLGLSVSFAAIDTTMSLDPSFTSSIYGMMTACDMVLLALSVAVLASAGAAPPERRADLGRLLLALVILFIYLDFMQLLIVWQSNLASEAPWYLVRSRGYWGALRVVIAVGHFVMPFALLLSVRMQRSRRVILGVAGLLVAMEVLRAWWTVLPALGQRINWVDVACMIGVSGVALGIGTWVAQRPAIAQRARYEARHV
jgi:hypothetical protein